MLIIVALPYAFWRLTRCDTVAPLVVVQIVAGILLGPGVLGHAFPELFAAIFTPAVIQALNGIAWWAVMLFVFVAGVELDLKDAWSHRGETMLVSGLALVVPLFFGALVGAWLLRSPGWAGEAGEDWQVIAAFGMASAVTALPILILFLEKLAILRTALGQKILRFASLDDLAIWAVLALILVDLARLGRQAIFLIAFALLALAVRKVMAKVRENDRYYLSLVWMALVALGSDWAGLHFMVGAFLAGAVIDRDWFDQPRLDAFRDHILIAIMPVFFLSTGLRTRWEMGGWTVALAAVALLVAAVGGKLAGVGLAGRILGWPKGQALKVGWLLQTKALIMIIFANVLLDAGVISSAAFTALLLMAVASTMLTMPMVRRLA